MSTNQTNQAVPQGARVNSQGALHIPRFAGMQLTGGPKHRAKTRQNAALPGELWQQLDDTIIDVYREQTDIVNDLRDAGLTTTVPMENEYTYWYKSRPMGKARTSMTPEPQTAEVTSDRRRTTVRPIGPIRSERPRVPRWVIEQTVRLEAIGATQFARRTVDDEALHFLLYVVGSLFRKVGLHIVRTEG